jgi:type I restriction enzyme, S subunit
VTDSTLPQGWSFSTIGEICESSQYGYTAKAQASGSVHFLRTTDITSGEIDWATVPYCSVSSEEESKYLLADGDVLISRAGSVGFSSLIKNPRRSVFASYLIRFRPLIDPQYFSYFLKTPSYWEAIGERSLGIAVQNVNATQLSGIQIPIAPLAEQTRIVEKLEELFSDLDAGVAELKAAQKKLAQYRQSLLKAAVGGALTAEWRTRRAAQGSPVETGAQLLTRILAERRRRWEEKLLAKFAAQGKTPPQDWQTKYSEPV